MLHRIQLGKLTLQGVSVAGVYTSLHVPELGIIFDVGIAPRSFVGAPHLLISHGHADHVGSLTTLLGIRGLSRAPAPRIFAPREIVDALQEAVYALNRVQNRSLEIDFVPVSPGDELELQDRLQVRVFRTLHSVPSVGYEVFRRVPKLRAEYLSLPAAEIQQRRLAGEDLFTAVERSEICYATDTLIDVLDQNPHLYQAKVLVLECTFLDQRKSRGESRSKGHVHWEEICERAALFQNEKLVLMHFSQLYRPQQVHEIVRKTCPAELCERIELFAPQKGNWPG